MSYYLYLGLPKPPFELEGVFPEFIDLTDMTNTPIGRAVLGSSRFGKVFSVTHCGCSTNILQRAPRDLDCAAAVRESIQRLEQTHRKLYFLVHWESTPVDLDRISRSTVECSLAEFLALFPRLEEGVRYVVLTEHDHARSRAINCS